MLEQARCGALSSLPRPRPQMRREAGACSMCDSSLQTHDAVTGIDVYGLSRDARSVVAEQEGSGIAHILAGDVSTKRRFLFNPAEDIAEAAHRHRAHGAQRPPGDGVDANVLRPQIMGKIACG